MTTLETYEHNYTRIQKKMGVSAPLSPRKRGECVSPVYMLSYLCAVFKPLKNIEVFKSRFWTRSLSVRILDYADYADFVCQNFGFTRITRILFVRIADYTKSTV